ncbi:MAG: SUMF1/EgtB/PvdO family nonheme iron enzyme [Nitrospinae bacterium]|nr:SUMF1/EgtB/PvdO family nonheme iron enzyme [Nitrospinota bacterium]
MNPEPITLSAVDRLIEALSGEESSEAFQLLKAIRQSFTTDADLEQIASLPSEELIARVYPQPEGAPESSSARTGVLKERLEALRSALNELLKKSIDRRLNPLRIVIGERNTFARLAEAGGGETSGAKTASAAAPQTPAPPRRIFKVSEMEFTLPEGMHKTFQEQLDRVNALEDSANAKLQAALEKEKVLEETRIRLEREKAEARSAFQNQLDSMHAQFEAEKALSQKEISRLRSEMEAVQKEFESRGAERQNVIIEYEERRNELERAFLQRERLFKEKFDDLADLIQLLHEDQKKFEELRVQETQRLKTREKQLKENAAQQMKKGQWLDAQTRILETNRKKLKAQLNKRYQEKLKELQTDFHRRSEYHRRRLDDEEKEREWLVAEKNKLALKEQTLGLEAQRKADEYIKKMQAELDARQKKLEEREQQLIETEKELAEDKTKLLATLKANREGKITLSELKIMAEEQSKLVNQRKKLLKALKEERGKTDATSPEPNKRLEEEKKEWLARMEEERAARLEEVKKLKDKEQELIVRETKELERLNNEFEELKNSLEVEQIEKETEIEEAMGKVREAESQLLTRQKEVLEKETEVGKRTDETEYEIFQRFNEIYQLKEELSQHQETVRKFLDHFHDTYQERLDFQNREYVAFKKNMTALREDAERLRQDLEEKEKTVREESAATLQAFGDRLKQREDMVDEMEKDLKTRLQDYQTFVTELHRVKEDMINQDQTRKNELYENLTHYEDKLMGLARAFEDLSEAFKREKDLGRIEVEPEEEEDKLEYDEDLAKAEWSMAVKNRLDPESKKRPVHIDFLYKFAGKWDQWVQVPPGRFWMGSRRPSEGAPFREAVIEKPLLIKKYPVTNIEFFQFIDETNYRTEAESGTVAIVFHNGQAWNADSVRRGRSYSNPTLAPTPEAFWLRPNGEPDALNEKFNHPVTQVTWNDAQAYCSWKSRKTGKKFRLPSEAEWEFTARNFAKTGDGEFDWDPKEMTKFYNIEETGTGDTAAVDFFPENAYTGGAQDMFGNVYEWTLDERGPTPGQAGKLVYKWARGGSFITPFKHVAPWRRISFSVNYSSSFLGFRVVCETL